MIYQTIIVDRAQGVATVTLNRPEKLNSFNKRMVDEFANLWQELSEDDEIRVIVLRAALESRAFSTGHDRLSEEQDSIFHPNLWTSTDPGTKLGPKQNNCWKPVIAAVHGMACGGAFYWLNECDILICSEDATFFDPHVTFGMTSAVEAIGALERMPYGELMRMVLLGNDERICAATALRIGLVSEVVSQGTLWERAHVLAIRIAEKSPAAIQGSVRAIWEAKDAPRASALQIAFRYCQLGNSVSMGQAEHTAPKGGAKRGFELR